MLINKKSVQQRHEFIAVYLLTSVASFVELSLVVMLESFLLESIGAVFASVFAAAVADGVEVGEEEEDEEKNKIMKTMEWKTVEVNLEGILPILSF